MKRFTPKCRTPHLNSIFRRPVPKLRRGLAIAQTHTSHLFTATVLTVAVSVCGTTNDSAPANGHEAGTTPCPKNIPPEMACIPGGKTILGSESKKWPDEHPRFRTHISTFLMDKYEVSVADYSQCVEAGQCTPAVSNYRHMRKKNFPQLKATWFQARAYCEFQGKRLPTEAEFEKAGRGPEGSIYPWGDDRATCSLAVIKETFRGCGPAHKPTGTVSPVGSRPAGIYGLYDIAGNAHEWVADWYEPNRKKCGTHCMGPDPKGPCGGKEPCPGYKTKVVKGGSWYWDWDWARMAKRRDWQPSNKPPHHFGFRCAKSVAQR